MTTIIEINDPQNLALIDAASDRQDWRSCADALIDAWINLERPFSSGEVASALRTHAPDLRFSVPGLGEHCRDRFYSDTMPAFPSTLMPPVQVPRMTDGLYPDRTPSDVEVFVYAADQQAGQDHPFEVYIPVPGQTVDDAPTPQPAQDRTKPGRSVISIMGAKVAAADIRANVRPDGRIEIPRNGFELAVHLGGQPMRGGDAVYASLNGTLVTVSQADPGNGAKSYTLSTGNGRVIVSPSALGADPATPGKKYIVEVGPGTLTLDLSIPAN